MRRLVKGGTGQQSQPKVQYIRLDVPEADVH